MPISPRQRTLAGFDDAGEQRPDCRDEAAQTRIAPRRRDAGAIATRAVRACHELEGPKGLCSRRPLAHLSGVSRDAGYEQPLGRADRGDLRLHARHVFDLLEKRKPDYLFVAFDVSERTFRNELYAEYKAHRDEMPADLRPQIPHIRRVLDALGVTVVEREGFEADDVLATIARRVEELGGECYLVTSDKDCRQLISEHVKMFNPRKGQVLDAEGLLADWGVRPDQVVDFQSLVGDSVDNIPGVPLIGPKTASQLLQQYETLEAVLDHAQDVKGKRGQNLVAFREQALLTRQLVRLDANVPIEINWNAGRVGQINRKRTLDLFQEFGFRRLGERLDVLAPEEIPPPVEWIADYHVVETLEELDQLVAELSQQRQISIDTETTSLSPRAAKVAGYAIAWKPGEACYIPVRAPKGRYLPRPR
jgi:DNA polymerase I